MNYYANIDFLPFNINIPQNFGIGISNQIGTRLKALGCTKVMVLYDKGIEAAGISDKIIHYIKEAGIECVIYNSVQADPPDNSVNEAGAIAVAEKVDGLVSVGGGSSIDTGKAVRVLTANEGPIAKYYDRAVPQKPGVPLAVIPTTSGTGSEVTAGGVITDTVNNIKVIVAGAGAIPTFSLVDPELTLGVPAHITAACAFDALAHHVDAVLSRFAGPMAKVIAADGIRYFRKSLHTVYNDGKNLEARTEMALAANIGGICINTGRCNISHATAHSLGAMYHVPHGVACSIFTPACIEYMAESLPAEIRRLAELFEVSYGASDSTADIGNMVAKAIYELARSVDIPVLKHYVPDIEDAYKLIPAALKDVFAYSSPRPFDEAGAKWVIDRTYSY